MGRTTRAVVIALCVSLCVATSLDVSGAPVAAQVQVPAQSAQRAAAVLTVISGDVPPCCGEGGAWAARFPKASPRAVTDYGLDWRWARTRRMTS